MPSKGTKSSYYEVYQPLDKASDFTKFVEDNPELGLTEKEVKQIASDIFDTASDVMISNADGLFLRELGYFAGTIYYGKKNVVRNGDRVITNLATDGDIYKMAMFPDLVKNNPLKFWSFRIIRDKAREMKSKILDEGVEYKNHYRFLKSL